MKMFEMEVEVGEPVEVGGLSVFPLTGVVQAGPAYLTGPEAFAAGLIEVDELDPPEVPMLAITNLADVPILLVEGEMLVGGDQNRTMNVTVLCPPLARTIVPVSCVEVGRWGARRKMFASSRHAPGSLRAAKTMNLEPRTSDVRAGVLTRAGCGKRLRSNRWPTTSPRIHPLLMMFRKKWRIALRSNSTKSGRSPVSWA